MYVLIVCIIVALIIFAIWFKAKDRVAVAALFQALAAIVLVFVTFWYVDLTRQLVDKQNIQLQNQREQFQLVNRPKVKLENPVGDIKGGVIPFVNNGGLSAKEFRAVWKIVTVEGDKVKKMTPLSGKRGFLSAQKEELAVIPNLEPEQIIKVPYYSNFDFQENPAFLIIAWSYQGPGVNGLMVKDDHFLWLANRDPKVWATTNLVGSGHIAAINQLKEKLRSELYK